jgi:hypothetical protein
MWIVGISVGSKPPVLLQLLREDMQTVGSGTALLSGEEARRLRNV